MSPSKCEYFDKGFCRQKSQCDKLHPSTDCDNKCPDQNACPFRHRKQCKNQERCLFYASKTCEFLHGSPNPGGNHSTEEIKTSLFNLNKHLTDIDQKIKVLDMQTKGSQSELRPDNFPPDDIIGKLEDKIKMLEEQNEKILERLTDMTCQIITNEYGNDEYMDEQMKDMKKEIAQFVNDIKEDGQREKCPPDKIFEFNITDDSVSVVNDSKEECHIEEQEEINQFGCDICESTFKTLANLKRHDQRFHLKLGTNSEFKCDFCNDIFADKNKLTDHALNFHKKCPLCAKRFSTTESLESHDIAVHKKRKTKHKIERDPSMKNHKNKRHN